MFTTKQLLERGGIFRNGIFVIITGHTINYYKEITENLWENYHYTSAEY